MIYSAEDLLPAVRARIERSALLRERVDLIGHVPHDRITTFFSAADLFVVGSHHEGSGYALMEACACGAVPVVTDIPTFRILTADGTLGALWNPGDAAGFAGVLADVARRDLPTLRNHLIQYFERELSWPAIGRRAVEIYRDVLSWVVNGRGRGKARSTRP